MVRMLKIQKSLHRILMDYFLIKSRGSYPGVISVKEIKVQPDLKKANVYLSVMGSPKEVDSVRFRLEEDQQSIRRLVGQRLRIKYCPYFHFFVNHISMPLSPVEQTLAVLREKGEI